jgi:hypothetical protein
MIEHCAYVHCRPDGSVFYVGKGRGARAKAIENVRRNPYYMKTVAKYGAGSIGVGLLECSSEKTAFELEIGLIRCFKRAGARLTNLTDGGEGKRGCPNSPEANARTADKNRGQKRSDEFRRRASEWMTNRVVSEDTRAKISAAVKQLPISAKFAAQWGSRRGAANGMARAVIGEHPEYGSIKFETMTAAAGYIGGSVAKVCRSIKLGHKHKGWSFNYLELM